LITASPENLIKVNEQNIHHSQEDMTADWIAATHTIMHLAFHYHSEFRLHNII